ncbi:transposase [Pseudonocardia sulfidoxydans NBRC 16205]|uniref:Transposase n=2 Tax=Pseudonocardia sulfidoxydans TaxID=54011 RepID=A0A511DQS0_9PSEU|nr:IS1634 family transposase [Pseudonocardia sulfidoxydans]GEL27149.1 transposase [Pseudonocardia sulfidoxydans NBRC 16205]
MFVRTSTRRNRDGSKVSYLQLAHNEWDPTAKTARTKVLYSFGRADQLDRPAIERLISALTRVVGVEPASSGPDRARAVGVPGLEFVESRPLGGAWLLDGLWHRLGIDTLLRRLAAGTRRDPIVERVLFALVANRALAPSSKLAATSWVAHDVHVPGLDAVSDDACYRAMDWLLQVEDQLARGVFDQVAHLLNLEVDLIFFDTTSTYFETEDPDEPVWRDDHGRLVEHDDTHADDGAAADSTADAEQPPAGATGRAGFRSRGKSKDSRDDLPQVVVGMAVTRDGIPVRVWCWPGNTSDSPLIRQVRDELRDWTLGKVIWVADRGFTSAQNRRHLAAGGGGYILGEKLRSGSAEATAALSRQGRYQEVSANLRVKEVKISESERFVVCHNPDAATRDAAVRANLVERLEAMISTSDRLTPRKRAELRGVISTKPGLNRFLRVTPGGLLRADAAKITADAKLDGKYLLRTSDPHLSTEDIALGYKQLLEVERGWRDMKQVLDLRPVYHRLEDRIRAHVLLCWLALLLARIVETRAATADMTTTWPRALDQLQRLHVGTFTGPAGLFRQTTPPSPEVRRLHTALDLALPPRILNLDPEPATR